MEITVFAQDSSSKKTKDIKTYMRNYMREYYRRKKNKIESNNPAPKPPKPPKPDEFKELKESINKMKEEFADLKNKLDTTLLVVLMHANKNE